MFNNVLLSDSHENIHSKLILNSEKVFIKRTNSQLKLLSILMCLFFFSWIIKQKVFRVRVSVRQALQVLECFFYLNNSHKNLKSSGFTLAL